MWNGSTTLEMIAIPVTQIFGAKKWLRAVKVFIQVKYQGVNSKGKMGFKRRTSVGKKAFQARVSHTSNHNCMVKSVGTGSLNLFSAA